MNWGGSEYLEVVHQLKCGLPPELNLPLEKKVQSFCRKMIEKGILASAHDCSLGGVAIALAESCIAGSIGAVIELKNNLRSDCCLFGETQSRIIVSIKASDYKKFVEAAGEANIPFQQIGLLKGDRFIINKWINLTVNELEKAWRRAE